MNKIFFYCLWHYKLFCVNGNTGFRNESRIFILYICKMKKIIKEKNQVVPDEVLSKEFISQFKTEADVSKFLKYLHVQVLIIYLHHFNLQRKMQK